MVYETSHSRFKKKNNNKNYHRFYGCLFVEQKRSGGGGREREKGSVAIEEKNIFLSQDLNRV